MIIPTIIALVVMLYFKGEITIGEFCLQVGAVAALMIGGLAICYFGKTDDIEVWNGQITAKYAHVSVPCSHSYQCHCHNVTTYSGSGKNRTSSTHEECDTCYEHFNDYDWDVAASTGERISIERIDRQGNDMPQRWAQAFVGEPFSSSHTFQNYILANPESVLLGTKGDMKQFGSLVPKYPDNVYDYYHHDPVVDMGVGANTKTWNWLISEVNKQLGPTKQVNINLLLVPTQDRAYMFALKDAWLGGKKNDVDIVIGVGTDGHSIAFADVLSWSTNKDMAVDLKNHIQSIGTIDRRDDIKNVIYTTVNNEFVRMHMKNMKWLMRSFQPSGTAMLLLFLLGLLAEGGLAWWCITNDIEPEAA